MFNFGFLRRKEEKQSKEQFQPMEFGKKDASTIQDESSLQNGSQNTSSQEPVMYSSNPKPSLLGPTVCTMDGEIVPSDEVKGKLDNYMVLFSKGSYTFHIYADCYEHWSQELSDKFEGWTIATPEEAEAAGHTQLCKICKSRFIEDGGGKKYTLEGKGPISRSMGMYYLRKQNEIWKTPNDEIDGEYIRIDYFSYLDVVERSDPGLVYVDFDSIYRGHTCTFSLEGEINPEVRVYVDGTYYGFLPDVVSLGQNKYNDKAKERMVTVLSNPEEYRYKAYVASKDDNELNFQINILVYRRFDKDKASFLGTTKLVKTTTKDRKGNFDYSTESLYTLMKIRNYVSDGKAVAFNNRGEIGELPNAFVDQHISESDRNLVGIVVGKGSTSSNNRYPIIDVYKANW